MGLFSRLPCYDDDDDDNDGDGDDDGGNGDDGNGDGSDDDAVDGGNGDGVRRGFCIVRLEKGAESQMAVMFLYASTSSPSSSSPTPTSDKSEEIFCIFLGNAFLQKQSVPPPDLSPPFETLSIC